jgi:hypothetical protein
MTYIIKLEPTSNCADPIRALRTLLKFGWRACGLKCTSAEQTTSPAPATPIQLDLFDSAADRRHGSACSPAEAAAQELLMPTKNDVFPSKYLKAADLNGRPLTLTIKSAPLEVLNGADGRQDQKMVLYFSETPKKMPLNRVNWDAVVDVTGEVDSDNWAGHKIEVFPTTTQMGGKTVDCIRIRTPMVRPSTRAKNKPATKPITEDLNDEIPL